MALSLRGVETKSQNQTDDSNSFEPGACIHAEKLSAHAILSRRSFQQKLSSDTQLKQARHEFYELTRRFFNRRIYVYYCRFVFKINLALFASIAVTHSAFSLTLTKNDELARDAALQWLQLLDGGRLEEAASQGSTEARSFDQWRDYLTSSRPSFGRLTKREVFELKHRPTFPNAFQVRKYYVLRFKTSFERRAGAIEEVVLAKIGCCWEIFGYSIAEVTRDN